MPLSKIIKTFVSSLALGIGMFTLPSTAYAQFSVVDVAALKQRALEELKTKAHFGYIMQSRLKNMRNKLANSRKSLIP